jgi:hypothetical protein
LRTFNLGVCFSLRKNKKKEMSEEVDNFEKEFCEALEKCKLEDVEHPWPNFIALREFNGEKLLGAILDECHVPMIGFNCIPYPSHMLSNKKTENYQHSIETIRQRATSIFCSYALMADFAIFTPILCLILTGKISNYMVATYEKELEKISIAFDNGCREDPEGFEDSMQADKLMYKYSMVRAARDKHRFLNSLFPFTGWDPIQSTYEVFQYYREIRDHMSATLCFTETSEVDQRNNIRAVIKEADTTLNTKLAALEQEYTNSPEMVSAVNQCFREYLSKDVIQDWTHPAISTCIQGKHLTKAMVSFTRKVLSYYEEWIFRVAGMNPGVSKVFLSTEQPRPSSSILQSEPQLKERMMGHANVINVVRRSAFSPVWRAHHTQISPFLEAIDSDLEPIHILNQREVLEAFARKKIFLDQEHETYRRTYELSRREADIKEMLHGTNERLMFIEDPNLPEVPVFPLTWD